MKSIAVIYPYFGVLPSQYKMWRASALRNPTVDFMFFTDADVEPANNIIVHKMRFSEFKEIVQKAFDFNIELDRPYKLCEYKQSYGYILQDYIGNYDFWGFGDLDVVLGDIRHFITDNVLTHKFLLGWGHLTLMHNDEDTNTYFMKQVDGFQYYKDAFTTSVITFFDEFDTMSSLVSKFDKSLLIFFPDNIFNFSCSSSPKISKEKLLFFSLFDFLSKPGYILLLLLFFTSFVSSTKSI